MICWQKSKILMAIQILIFQLKHRSDTTLIVGEEGCIVDICNLSLDILAEVISIKRLLTRTLRRLIA